MHVSWFLQRKARLRFSFLSFPSDSWFIDPGSSFIWFSVRRLPADRRVRICHRAHVLLWHQETKSEDLLLTISRRLTPPTQKNRFFSSLHSVDLFWSRLNTQSPNSILNPRRCGPRGAMLTDIFREQFNFPIPHKGFKHPTDLSQGNKRSLCKIYHSVSTDINSWSRARFISTKLWRDAETSVFDIKDVLSVSDIWRRLKEKKCFKATPFENVACEIFLFTWEKTQFHLYIEYVHIGYWTKILTRENKIILHVNQAFSQVTAYHHRQSPNCKSKTKN